MENPPYIYIYMIFPLKKYICWICSLARLITDGYPNKSGAFVGFNLCRTFHGIYKHPDRALTSENGDTAWFNGLV